MPPFISVPPSTDSYYLQFPSYLSVFTGMLIISHLWMGNMEESVYLCRQKLVSCIDNPQQREANSMQEDNGHH